MVTRSLTTKETLWIGSLRTRTPAVLGFVLGGENPTICHEVFPGVGSHGANTSHIWDNRRRVWKKVPLACTGGSLNDSLKPSDNFGSGQSGEFEVGSGQSGTSHPQLERFSSVGDVNGIPKMATNEAKSLWKKPLMRARLGLEGRGLSWMDEFFLRG